MDWVLGVEICVYMLIWCTPLLFFFYRRRTQLVGLMTFLNFVSGFDFDGPVSPKGSRFIDRVGNISVSILVEFCL